MNETTMDNEKLAALIYGLAQYENYNTSFLQTVKNLSSSVSQRQFSNENDRTIFEDLLKAIQYASQQTELTVSVFKAINGQMDSKMWGQPENPGKLRHDFPITVGDYVPKETVTREDVQRELDTVTDKSKKSGWELYARLAKLQAFDNGNKRTALVAANCFIGALQEQTNYLIIPSDYRRLRFDANLMDYYMADDWDDHLPNTEESLENFVAYALTIDS